MAFLHGVEVVELDGGPRPISGVASSVIGLVGTAKKGPTNVPTLIAGSRTAAIAQFGVPDGESTIPDALDAILDQGGAMIVVVNVQAKKDVAAADYTLDSDSGAVELADFYVSDVVVTNSDGSTTYVQGVDYVINSKAGSNGNDLLTRLEDGSIVSASEALKVAYKVADDTSVAGATEVVGATSDEGIQALLGAESKVHVTPRILIAPGFTSENAAGTVNEASAKDIVSNLVTVANRLRAIAIADGPEKPENGNQDAIDYQKEIASGGARLYMVDPYVLVVDSDGNEVKQPASARVAGVIAKSDNERGFWYSPSNRPILGISGTARGIDFALGDRLASANLLNENKVATVIHQDGYRLWGNRSCSSDPKWAFISVRRTADLINDALLRAHLWAVDRNITKTYVEDVVEGVNNYLRHLKAIGAIINGKCWADADLNTPDQIVQGKIYFDFDFTPPYPAEHITFRSSLVNDYLEEIFA